MICEQFSTLLGFQCHPLSDDGSVALIDTSFTFQDGDFVPVYVQHIAGQVRFFDAGETILHFLGRGVNVKSAGKAKFLKTLSDRHGAKLNSEGEIEAYASYANASGAFANYMSTMLAIVRWENDQQGIASDIDLLVEEVSMYFRAAYPDQSQTVSPEYLGISGHVYKFDFIHGDKAVMAITPHHASVSSAIKKIVDLNQKTENDSLNTLIVIDDRHDPIAASNETKILTAISNVLPMTELEKKANLSGFAS